MPEHPILIAYDGSKDAKSAIARAAELLTPGPALVVTIWAAAERSVSTSAGLATYAPIFGEIDELERTILGLLSTNSNDDRLVQPSHTASARDRFRRRDAVALGGVLYTV